MTQQDQRATINGREIDISEGETIFEAAARVGVAVPILCHDERVTPSATCRVCVVNVEGRRLPIAACAQKIEPGMTVVTEDDDLATVTEIVEDPLLLFAGQAAEERQHDEVLV